MIKIITTLALLMALPALAATECGQPGTGKIADGTVQTRTAEQARGTFVADDGFWTLCPPSKAAPPSAPCVPQTTSFREWSQGPYNCTTADGYASSSDSPARDRVLLHGQSGMWRQWQGPMRGALIERCNDGVRTVVTAFCSPTTHCDVRVEIHRRGESYVYDARGGGRVPVGGTVQAVAASGKTMALQCVQGDFRVTR